MAIGAGGVDDVVHAAQRQVDVAEPVTVPSSPRRSTAKENEPSCDSQVDGAHVGAAAEAVRHGAVPGRQVGAHGVVGAQHLRARRCWAT